MLFPRKYKSGTAQTTMDNEETVGLQINANIIGTMDYLHELGYVSMNCSRNSGEQ